MTGAHQAEGLHIERLSLSAVLLALVFSTMLQTSVIPPTDSQMENARFAAPCRQPMLSDADTAIELTWVSRWEFRPQAVLNNSELVGDHIVLNATFLGQEGFIEPYEMTMNITGMNTIISSPNSSIVYDTYPSRYNFTTSVLVRIENGVNETIIGTFYNLSICNFFSPSLSRIRAEKLESEYYNISWSSEDRNADDVHFYSLWLSNDGGISYVQLIKNLTNSQYSWNSSGWLNTDYIVRVRAYSVDLSCFGGPFIDIPDDYWPGDYADGYSSSFEHDGPFYTGTADVSVIPASDLTYYWGSINNRIKWRLALEFLVFLYERIPDSVAYIVTHDGKSHVDGSQPIGRNFDNTFIIVQIDGLGLGVHSFTLVFRNPGDNDGIVSDTVRVTVQLSLELHMIGVYMIVGAGIAALILVSTVIITRIRRM